MLHNTRKIHLFLTQKAKQVLVQARHLVSGLQQFPSDWSACMFHQHLQLIQNAAAWWSSTYPSSTLLRHPLNWLPKGFLYPVKINGAFIPCCEWLRPIQNLEQVQTRYPSPSLSSATAKLIWGGPRCHIFPPLISGQQKPYKSSIADWILMEHIK